METPVVVDSERMSDRVESQKPAEPHVFPETSDGCRIGSLSLAMEAEGTAPVSVMVIVTTVEDFLFVTSWHW